jgi:DNA invertase Pin-like site-specific DNA recombinase
MTLQSDQTKQCFECGQPATYKHHVVPESLGGKKTVLLCGHCHPKAHGKKGYWSTGELIKTQLQKRKEQGKWIGGNIPYGKKRNNDHLIDNPEELANIELMIKWRMDGQTYPQIAAKLTEMGIPTKLKTASWRGHRVQQIVTRFIEDPCSRADLIKKQKQNIKASGKFLGGYPNYGYKVENRQALPNRAEGDIIKRMYVLQMMGKSYSAIARWLNSEGVPSQRKKIWRHITVRDILKANGRKRPRWTRAPL